MLPWLLMGAGALKGLVDTHGARQQADANNEMAIANAWTGKDWNVKKVSPWQYLSQPAIQGGMGYLAGTHGQALLGGAEAAGAAGAAGANTATGLGANTLGASGLGEMAQGAGLLQSPLQGPVQGFGMGGAMGQAMSPWDYLLAPVGR